MIGETHKEAGFTLVEVLISMFIFALITAGTMTALSQSIRGQDRLAASMDELNQLNAARAIVKADMSSLVLRLNRDELGGREPYFLTTDGEAILTFMRRGIPNPGGLEKRGDLQRVEYHFKNDTLLRRGYSHENPAQASATFDRVLMKDLEDVSLSIMTFEFNNLTKTEGFRLPAYEEMSFSRTGIVLDITNQYGDLTEHIFEIGE